ncbi:MAG: transcription termination/antitermination protein NusA [Oscillospiraceae bacterium]|nr:transcription termination/antitermination protein NusA [Oscillospiraceae bacterium]MBQ9929785.1 transcription termination/antitermination protein NusA [Oscillospiraceae bacterium]
MARNTRAKKQAAAPKVNLGAEIFASLRELEKTKGIPVDYMVERLKQGMANAYRKDREDRKDVPAENVVVDLSEDGLYLHVIKAVVAEVEDDTIQIHIDAARNLNPDVQIGDNVSIEVDFQKFGRIAAQTFKQVVIQGIREAERGVVYDNYSDKAQELLTGTVVKIDVNGDMFVRVGQGAEASDAVMRVSEQIPGETWREGDKIKVYVLELHKMGRGPIVHVSRTHPNMVRRLFELETPEIADGQVEIRNIAREAGSRSKMAVRATVEDLDPVGACVGPRGGRVGAVVRELYGEKIDIVVWSEDPCEYVKAALSPADVISVTAIPGQKACRVIVPDDQLSLAIGKEGQNARLAARLTGYKIDIKPASQAEE